MIDELIKKLEQSKDNNPETLRNKIYYLTHIEREGEYLGRVVETLSRNSSLLRSKSKEETIKEVESYYFYMPLEESGVVIRAENSDFFSVSHGHMSRDEFIDYYDLMEKNPDIGKDKHSMAYFKAMRFRNKLSRYTLIKRKYSKLSDEKKPKITKTKLKK
ncbi:MAG: hypothetical protein KKF46_05870 [Nanoarchaeota archaeon]|nr:hypothetical protein [Nanoarchaeota archaeon]MBU1321860.1 hypothetical protein [Nanoarchaeota archaeon]MBU1597205.1 hypothetical protein [Nanoarchaeota archaeon]MBU2441904.1 hypothetical protein [Nanoarchaeota archaeon]